MAGIVKNIGKLFTGTLISRLFGLVREMVVARSFGTSAIADAFTIALMIPNILRQILGEDMVERAFMPPFKTLYDEGEPKRAWRFISVTFNWFFLILFAATALLYLIIPALFSLKDTVPALGNLLFSSDSFDYDLTLKLTLILLPFMIFIGLAAFVGSMLNFFHRNWIFAFAPVSLSVGVILGILLLKPYIGGYSIAVGYVLGAALQFIVQLPFLFTKKFRDETKISYSLKLKDRDNDYSVMKRESVIITINSIFNKSSEIFGRVLATRLVQGATSSLFYANRLFQLPFGIISLSIVRGVNPTLNAMKSSGDKEAFSDLFFKGMKLYYLLIIPTIVLMITASKEIVYLIYYGNRFGEESLMLTAGALVMYTIGLFPMSLVGYYNRVLSLFSKNSFALKISIVSAVANISLALLLTSTTSLGHRAIALASTLSFFINMIILRGYIHRELNLKRNRNAAVMVFCSTILAVSLLAVSFYFQIDFISSKLSALLGITLKGAVTAAVFGLYLVLLKKKKIV